MSNNKIFYHLPKLRISSLWRAAAMLLLPLFLTGCIGIGLGDGGGGKTNGQFLKGSVAKGFPGVPLYPKAQIGESFGNGNDFGANFVANEKLEKVVKFYSDNLGRAGWQAEMKRVAENHYVFEIKNDKFQGTLIVNLAADGKKTAITVSLSSKTPIS